MDTKYVEILKDATFQRKVAAVIISAIDSSVPGDDVIIAVESSVVKLTINLKFE